MTAPSEAAGKGRLSRREATKLREANAALRETQLKRLRKALEQILARFVTQWPHGFAEAENIARAALERDR